MKRDVVIVGAGLSGLYAAYLLEQAGYAPVVLEARERLGGRVWSDAPQGQAHRFDLGPTWLWPAINPRMERLAQQLDLQVFTQFNSGAVVVEGVNNDVRRYASSYGEDTSSKRIEGGMLQLVHALFQRLQRSTLVLNTAVTAIHQQDDGRLVVHAQRNGTDTQWTAAHVITAVPLRVLAARVDFEPAWPSELLHTLSNTPTWMAGQAKLVATYAQPFWRAERLSGTAQSHRGPLVEIHDASSADGSQAALFGFFGVQAKFRQQLGEAKLLELGLQQLERLFGPEAANPLWAEVKEWSTDPWTATPEDSLPLGHHPNYARPVLPDAWQSSLYLAGTESAPDYGGYLEGALEAAELAVAQLRASAGHVVSAQA